ncbi:MAG: hypothetical protein AAF211_31935, partial [Myxococcota bacterium]
TLAFSQQVLGGIATHEERWADAEMHFASALRWAMEGDGERRGSILHERAHLRLRRRERAGPSEGDLDAVGADLEAAESLLRAAEAIRELLPALCVRARFLRLRGDPASAEVLLEEVEEGIRQQGWDGDAVLEGLLEEARRGPNDT